MFEIPAETPIVVHNVRDLIMILLRYRLDDEIYVRVRNELSLERIDAIGYDHDHQRLYLVARGD
jgi:hypothetical protein